MYEIKEELKQVLFTMQYLSMLMCKFNWKSFFFCSQKRRKKQNLILLKTFLKRVLKYEVRISVFCFAAVIYIYMCMFVSCVYDAIVNAESQMCWCKIGFWIVLSFFMNKSKPEMKIERGKRTETKRNEKKKEK